MILNVTSVCRNMVHNSSSLPLGLIAGQGDLPKLIIKHCYDNNRPIFVIAIEEQTPQETVVGVDHIWLKLGKLAAATKALQQRGIKELVLTGGIRRPNFSNLSLDWGGIKLIAAVGKAIGDDALLTGVSSYFEAQGIKVIPSNEILESLSPKVGTLTRKKPTEEDLQDIEKGIKILEVLGDADIGQAIIIQQGQILGIEAIEGTERLILRIKDYKIGPTGGTLIKMSKPNQSMKVDLPTIGIKTVEQCHSSQLSGIAIEANRSQIIDQESVVALADQLGLFVHVFEKR